MPPLFTSTSWTTLVRKVVVAMVYAPKPAMAISKATTPSPRRTINNIRRTKQVINQLFHSSFPSLSIPSHQLNYATIPIKSSSRHFASSSKPTNISQRLGPVRQGLQNGGIRPKWVNGLSIPANVGLGTAKRTFVSTAPSSAQNAMNGKIPMVFRAFASLIDDEDKTSTGKSLPRASRYTPYSRSKVLRKRGAIRRYPSKSIDSSFIEDLKHYFPLPTRSSSEKEKSILLPLIPETLITEGEITVLALPLSPSLESLLSPSMSSSPYNETSIGISILAKLTKGLLPIHDAFSLHSSTRIIPLLTKLDGLGILDYHPGSPRTEAEVIHDINDQPDILRIIFNDRSISDVRTLLGESLRGNEEGQWWALYDGSELKMMELNHVETRDIMEQWGSPIIRPTISTGSSESEHLVFPTLDMSINEPQLDEEENGEVIFDISESILSTPSDSWPSTGTSTPGLTAIDSPLESSTMTSSSASSVESLSASLLSRLSEPPEGDADWLVRPSDSDSDVESAFSESEEWNQVDQILSASSANNGNEDEGVAEREVVVSWSGSGEGFGFLAQPW